MLNHRSKQCAHRAASTPSLHTRHTLNRAYDEVGETMNKITMVTPAFAVAAVLTAADFATLARLGFKSVISNRPDNEEPGQLTAREEAVLAQRAGLQFRHVPASKHDIFTDEVVDQMAEALSDLEGPVLAHCKSGTRSLMVWAAASARIHGGGPVLETIRLAGEDMEFLRQDLEAQAKRA